MSEINIVISRSKTKEIICERIYDELMRLIKDNGWEVYHTDYENYHHCKSDLNSIKFGKKYIETIEKKVGGGWFKPPQMIKKEEEYIDVIGMVNIIKSHDLRNIEIQMYSYYEEVFEELLNFLNFLRKTILEGIEQLMDGVDVKFTMYRDFV